MEKITNEMQDSIVSITENPDITFGCHRCNKLLTIGTPYVKMQIIDNCFGYFCLACSKVYIEPNKEN